MIESIQRRNRRHAKAGGGFSLVEALVVVAIVGLVSIIAFDEGAEMIRTSKAQAAGTQVTFALQRARQNAVAEKVPFFFRMITSDGSRVERLEILRDDGSGFLEIGTDEVVQGFIPEISIFLGDGRGNTTDLPTVAPNVFGVAFGLRGEARDPGTRALLSAVINVGSAGAERHGWVKYAAIDIQPAGIIRQRNVREHI